MKIAEISPFHKTPPAWLQQCIASVERQTVPCTHLLVCDGDGAGPGDYSASGAAAAFAGRLEAPCPRADSAVLGKAGDKVVVTDIVLRHLGYQEPSLRREKVCVILRHLLLEQQDDPEDPFTLFNLACSYLDLGDTEKAAPNFMLCRGFGERCHLCGQEFSRCWCRYLATGAGWTRDWAIAGREEAVSQ